MRTLAALMALASLAGSAICGQIPRRSYEPVRIPIRHADPWFVKAMLEGIPILTPELSTILGFAGLPPQTGQALGGLFTGGKLIVNPTDNSLWFYPDR